MQLLDYDHAGIRVHAYNKFEAPDWQTGQFVRFAKNPNWSGDPLAPRSATAIHPGEAVEEKELASLSRDVKEAQHVADEIRSAAGHRPNEPMSPRGTVVTDDYPDDHKHQHGIFTAWTKTEYEGRDVKPMDNGYLSEKHAAFASKD